jgi:type I restriction enzyme S subunit
MSEWKETTLADLCTDISYGYTESAKQEKVGPKFLRITDIASGRLEWDKVPYCPINESDFEKYKLLPGDIVIARTGATTGANYTIKESDPKDVVFASYLIRYKINPQIAYPYYIGQLLKSPNWSDYVDAIAGGSAQPGANAKQLGSFDIILPPLPEQKAIASILSCLDDKIDLLHRQNATLEKMAETLFRQWFVERRPEPVEGKAKEEWEEGKVSDYALHLKDSIQPQKNPSTFYFHYSISSFDNGRIPITKLGEEVQSNKYKVQKNCILFSKLNPHKEKRVWLLQDEVEENSICSTEFQVIFPKNKQHLYFLYGWLTFNENYNEIACGVGGTSGSHQRIDPKTIFEFQCPLISDSVIENFNVKIKPIFKKQVINQIQIRTLMALRDTLLPKLMSGEIRVL